MTIYRVGALASAAFVVALFTLTALFMLGVRSGEVRTRADTLIFVVPDPDTVEVTRPPAVLHRPVLSEEFGAFVVEDSARGLLSCFDHAVWYE